MRSVMWKVMCATVLLTACGDESGIEPADFEGEDAAVTVPSDNDAGGDSATNNASDAGVSSDAATTTQDAKVAADGAVLHRDGGAAVPGDKVRLTHVMREVFVPANCATCHPVVTEGVTDIDLRSTASAMETLLNDTREVCDGKPYVTPGDPSRSFLFDVISRDNPGCGVPRMPNGLGRLSDAQIDLVRTWIQQGAAVSQ